MAPSLQQEPSPVAGAPSVRAAFVLAVACVVGVAAWLEWPNFHAAVGQDRVCFVDPDDYTRVFRSRLITDGAAARIRHLTQINYPAGAELHWTAPMDYLLLGAYRLVGLTEDAAEARARVAALAPGVLGILYLLCMMAFLHRGFGPGPAVLAGLLTALSPAFHRVFQVGHPDHHCLLELLLLVALGAWIPRRGRDGSPSLPTRAGAIIGGCALGMAVWVAAQAVFLWAVLAAGLTWACVFGPAAERRVYASARFAWSCATAGVILAGFLVENWPDLNVVAVDQISLIHLALAGLVFLAPARAARQCVAAASHTSPEGPPSDRICPSPALLLVALAAFGAWLMLDRARVFQYVSSPEFYRWSAQIAELLPLYTRTATDWSLTPMHALTGWLPYAVPPLVVFFAMSKRGPRAVKITLVLLAPVVMALTIAQRRWLDHLNLAVTPVVVIGMWELAGRVLARDPSRFRLWHRLPAGGSTGQRPVPHTLAAGAGVGGPRAGLRFALSAVVLGLLVHTSSWVLISFTPAQAVANSAYQRRTDFAAQCINRDQAAQPSGDYARQAILSDEGEGPMLLYRTGRPVVSAPYHRALPGILEAARFFAERDPAEARAQLDRLGVRYIVVPQRPHEQLMHFEKLVFGELRSFDPPTESINESGRLQRQFHYRPEFVQTVAYRLAMQPDRETLPGVRCVQTIFEGAKTPDGRPFETGLLYVVDDLPIGP